MVFNFTTNYHFNSRYYLGDKLVETVGETKLLGTIINSDLTWWKNTNYITQKAYQRMQILRKLVEFSIPLDDLVLIYTLYVRSILEFNCCVWTFNITKAEKNDIERVQKTACRIILKEDYISYENALETLNLVNLQERRIMLCKRFAKNSLRYDKSKDMFPLDENRNRNKFKIKFAKHSRLLNSAIPQMQRLLNEE